MAWQITEQYVVTQAIDASETTQAVPFGTIVKAFDDTYGAGEFIYLKGVGSTVVGSLVTWNSSSFLTTLVPNTANLNNPVAAAMSANAATTSYGWYQVGGLAIIKKTAVAIGPQVPVYISGTAGRVRGTAASGKQIVGARSANAATVAAGTSTILVLINRSFAQGAVA